MCREHISVRRCWPLCFIPLTMSGDKSARTLCPHCGYDYGGLCSAVDERSAPECASSRGKFGNFATVRSRGGCIRRVQPSYREDRQVSGYCTVALIASARVEFDARSTYRFVFWYTYRL